MDNSKLQLDDITDNDSNIFSTLNKQLKTEIKNKPPARFEHIKSLLPIPIA